MFDIDLVDTHFMHGKSKYHRILVQNFPSCELIMS